MSAVRSLSVEGGTSSKPCSASSICLRPSYFPNALSKKWPHCRSHFIERFSLVVVAISMLLDDNHFVVIGLTDFLYQRDGETIAFARSDLAVSGTGSSSVAPVVGIRAKSVA